MEQFSSVLLIIIGIISLYVTDNKKIHYGFIIASLGLGVLTQAVQVPAAGMILLFMVMCYGYFKYLQSGILKSILFFLVGGVAAAFYVHLIPGFKNPLVWQNIQLSPISYPYSLYFNIDKGLIALILALAGGMVIRQPLLSFFQNKHFWFAFTSVLVLCSVLGVLSHYIAWDPKGPMTFGIWGINNLLLVCFAEEVLFRGFVQRQVTVFFDRYQISYFFPLFISAVIFGLAHYKGGPALIGLATIAGLFYGYAYHHTKRIEASTFVHFGLNAAHFLFFTYPAYLPPQ